MSQQAAPEIAVSPGSSNTGPGLGLGGGASAATLLVAQMLTGNVNGVTGTTAPFGLIIPGNATNMMDGVERVESGRSSASGTVTVGDQETVVGDSFDQEMEGGNVTGLSSPNVPGYEDLRVLYVIVCVPHILQERLANGEIGEVFHEFTHVKRADQNWWYLVSEPHPSLQGKVCSQW